MTSLRRTFTAGNKDRQSAKNNDQRWYYGRLNLSAPGNILKHRKCSKIKNITPSKILGP